jgi:tRNA U38,U39,U40 pseudouridine synthase TruA
MEKIKRDFFKQKVALFIGYNGKGYSGLQAQKNSTIPTIEKSIFEALCAANLVSETNIMELK